jgi:hypothetical protein
MNKFLLTIFIVVILGSILYAWYIYIYRGDYEVSVTIDDQTYHVRNGEIENCLQQSTCLLAE